MREIIFLNEDIENSFKEKVNKVLEIMKDIEYGTVLSNGTVGRGEKEPEGTYSDDNKNFPQKPQDTLKYKVGHCIDQSELERYLFDKLNIKNKVYSMFPADGTGKYYNHNFIVIFDDAGHPFWIENSWKQYRGAHKYDNLDELFDDIATKHQKSIKEYRGEKKILPIEIYEFPKKFGMSWDEFTDFVFDNCKRVFYKRGE